MFSSVLVPLDGTSFSEQSLPLARIVGSTPATRLHLVSVNDDFVGTEDYLNGVADDLRVSSLEVDQAVVGGGKIVEALEGYAKQVGADLIVMATHGRSGLDRFRLGSVAEGLVTRGIAPILLFHPEEAYSTPEAIEHVVIPLDHSAHAQSILGPAETFGKAANVSRYTIVHVAESKGVGKAGWTPIASIQAQAMERLTPIRERLGADGATVDVQVVMAADPAEGILGVANEVGADLIAMTTHGMTGLRPTLVGSVAAEVLHKWHGSLLLRRPVA